MNREVDTIGDVGAGGILCDFDVSFASEAAKGCVGGEDVFGGGEAFVVATSLFGELDGFVHDYKGFFGKQVDE